jgi:hypothetical protein
MQLLVAQANVGYDQPLSIKLLNYVIAATATPWSTYLNYQAISLRNSISKSATVFIMLQCLIESCSDRLRHHGSLIREHIL